MKIKFLKDYRYPGGGYSNKGDVQNFEDAEFAKWAIDNGFAEEVKEPGGWKPKYNEEYFYVGNDSSVHPCIWENDLLDNSRLKLGFVFKTERATERYRDYQIAVATVRQDDGVLTPEQATKNGYVYYIRSHAVSGLGVHGFNADYISVNTLSFDTSEHAEASLDKHPDEWKIIVNYDWSRE